MSMTFYQGEADPEITFTIKDKNGSVLDVSTATLALDVKSSVNSSKTIFTKANGDFDVTDAATGIVKVAFTSSNTNQVPGTYYGEITVTFSAANVSKYQFEIIINREV